MQAAGMTGAQRGVLLKSLILGVLVAVAGTFMHETAHYVVANQLGFRDVLMEGNATQYSGSLTEFPMWKHAYVALAGPAITLVGVLLGVTWSLVRPGPFAISVALVHALRSPIIAVAFACSAVTGFRAPPQAATPTSDHSQMIHDPTEDVVYHCDETTSAVLLGLPEASFVILGFGISATAITYLLSRVRAAWNWRQLALTGIGSVAGFLIYVHLVAPAVFQSK